jgi:hypothetical protein
MARRAAGTLTIAQIKEEVGVQEVLLELGGSIPYTGAWGEWVPVRCYAHRDDNPSGSMNRGAGMYICHQCGAPGRENGKAGDIVDMAKDHLQSDSITEAISWIRQTFLT